MIKGASVGCEMTKCDFVFSSMLQIASGEFLADMGKGLDASVSTAISMTER